MDSDKTKVGYAAPQSPAQLEPELETQVFRPPDRLPPSSSGVLPSLATSTPSGEGDTVVLTDVGSASGSLLRFTDHTPHKSTAAALHIGRTLQHHLRMAALKHRLAKLLALGGATPSTDSSRSDSGHAPLRIARLNLIAFLMSTGVGVVLGAVAIGLASRSGDAVHVLDRMPLEVSSIDVERVGIAARQTSLEIVVFPSQALLTVDGVAMPGVRELNYDCTGPVSVQLEAPGYLTERYTFECGRPVLLIAQMRAHDEESSARGWPAGTSFR